MFVGVNVELPDCELESVGDAVWVVDGVGDSVGDVELGGVAEVVAEGDVVAEGEGVTEGVAEGVAEGDAEQSGPVAQLMRRTLAASPTNSEQLPRGPSATDCGERRSENTPPS